MQVPLPILKTPRLQLRPFTEGDAPDVQRLAGAREIADTTLTIPHPYADGLAEQWIAGHAPAFEAGTHAVFAIVLRDGGQLVGTIGLTIDRSIDKGELGYWVGKPYWGRGYCTEAATAILDYGFATLGLNRVSARHLVRNPASGRVLQKIGMTREGRARQDTVKWGKYEDLVLCGILRSEWQELRNA